MNTVYVLIALVYSGHFINSIVPTLEFKTLEKCQAAIQSIANDASGKKGEAYLRCVKVEK